MEKDKIAKAAAKERSKIESEHTMMAQDSQGTIRSLRDQLQSQNQQLLSLQKDLDQAMVYSEGQAKLEQELVTLQGQVHKVERQNSELTFRNSTLEQMNRTKWQQMQSLPHLGQIAAPTAPVVTLTVEVRDTRSFKQPTPGYALIAKVVSIGETARTPVTKASRPVFDPLMFNFTFDDLTKMGQQFTVDLVFVEETKAMMGGKGKDKHYGTVSLLVMPQGQPVRDEWMMMKDNDNGEARVLSRLSVNNIPASPDKWFEAAIGDTQLFDNHGACTYVLVLDPHTCHAAYERTKTTIVMHLARDRPLTTDH